MQLEEKVFDALIDIQRELSELRGEVRGFTKSVDRIDSAAKTANMALQKANEAASSHEEFAKSYMERQENLDKERIRAASERRSTRRWLIGTLIAVVGLFLTVFFNIQ